MTAGLDLGSSSVKLLLTDGKQSYIFRSSHLNRNIRELWECVLDVFGQADKFLGCSGIEALGITSQSCSYILYDGTQVSPFYDWSGLSNQSYVEQVKGKFTRDEFIKFTSMLCPPMNSYPMPGILWFQSEKKSEWKRMRKLLQPKDYIYYRMTGLFVSDRFMWRGLANSEKNRFEEEALKRIGVEIGQLPQLADIMESPGGICGEAAKELHMKTGTPVFTGCNDFFSGLLGMGIMEKGQVFDVTGTSEHIGTVTGTLQITEKMISGAYIRDYVLYGVNSNSGRSIQWMNHCFPAKKEVDIYEVLKNRPPVYLPYLEGERAPIWKSGASGIFWGIRSRHRAEDFRYAVYEGTVFSIYHIWKYITEKGDKGVVVGGGAGRNELLNLMKASLFEREIIVLEEKETSALGAVICAAVGSGKYADIEDAVGNLVKTDRIVSGKKDIGDELRDRFHTYEKLVAQMMPLWEE